MAKKIETPTWMTEKEWQEKIGIFRSYLKKPNESVWELADLKYGRDDYASIKEVPPNKNKENEKYYDRTAFGHWRLKPDWRSLLERPDPWAGIPIHVDPTYEWALEDGGVIRREYILWQPHRLLTSVCCPGPVVDGILAVINQSGMADTRPLTKAINTHFRTIFMPTEEKAWKSLRLSEDGEWWVKNFAEVSWEQHKQKTLNYWDETVHLVAGCLLHHFQVWPECWMNHLHGSQAIEDLFADAKFKIELRKAGGLDFEFAD